MWVLPNTDARFFTAEERAHVEALFEAILPATAHSPGATDANAAEYLDRLLALDGATYYEIPRWQELYRTALAAVVQAAAAHYGAPLGDLSPEQRHELLTQLQRGELDAVGADVDQRRFFAVLRGHCIEGCFADPRWGGNPDRVIWRWYGYLQPAQPFKRAGESARAVGEASAAPTQGGSLTRPGA
jgi:gluconate 2-dehydrogenase gamma chain